MRILILDDHPLFADALSQIVARLEPGITIDLAESTKQAFELIEKGYNHDLILVDLKLQGLDGFGFIRALNDKFITSPVIVVSSNENIMDIQHAYELGAMGFIHKSAQSNEILSALKQVLAGNVYRHADYNLGKSGDDTFKKSTENNDSADLFGISARQYAVLCLINNGLSNKEIARKLDISESTVKTHVSRLIESLAVHNRTACVTEALRLGLL